MHWESSLTKMEWQIMREYYVERCPPVMMSKPNVSIPGTIYLGILSFGVSECYRMISELLRVFPGDFRAISEAFSSVLRVVLNYPE